MDEARATAVRYARAVMLVSVVTGLSPRLCHDVIVVVDRVLPAAVMAGERL